MIQPDKEESWYAFKIFFGKGKPPKEVLDDAYIFLMLQFAAIPFTIGYNLLSGQIRALGHPLLCRNKSGLPYE